jgi:uncharacterized membrane protein YqjE
MTEENQSEQSVNSQQSNLDTSINWLLSIASLFTSVFRLAIEEASLAKEDLSRLVLICLLVVPIFLLTWIALGVLAAWIVFELTAWAAMGFATFAAIQLVTSLILISKLKTYRHSLTLPATRAQISAIFEEIRHEARKPTAPDRNA